MLPPTPEPSPAEPRTPELFSPEHFSGARERIAPLVRATPLLEAPELARRLGRPVWLKLENLQVTGSFKARGAASFLTAPGHAEAARDRGVVTCSSGNHGRAVAYMAARLGVRADVFVPEWVDPVKLAAIRATGARAHLAGASYDEAEAAAQQHAADCGARFVSPFDDPEVIAGQGTLALELLEELAPPFDVALALSGGGLAGGVAAALAARQIDARTVAVSAQQADVMLRSLEHGHPIEVKEEPTLAGALAGGIGLDNRHTFNLVKAHVHTHVRVTEDQIARAMVHAATRLHLRVEGGGAVALAAALHEAHPLTVGAGSSRSVSSESASSPGTRSLVIVLSGGNVDGAVLAQLLEEHQLRARRGDEEDAPQRTRVTTTRA
jgi:threonine dehydratase